MINPELRTQVIRRAGGCCEYCLSQRAFSPSPFSIEHVIPSSRGGTTELGNLALACQGCNNYKYNHLVTIDPVTMVEVPLYDPRRQVWSEHFAWSSDFTEVIGLTASGRATVARLRLNRPELKALRKILAEAHLHPPLSING